MLFVDVLLPIFLIILAGYVLDKRSPVDSRALTIVSLYLMAPALVFSALIRNPASALLTGQLALFMLAYTALILLLGVILCHLMRFSGDVARAFYLTTAMMNVGNYGLPLAWFAYGDAGLEVSVLVFVLFNIPLGSLAIVIAQKKGTGLAPALGNMLRIPIFHAVVLAFAVRTFDIALPEFLMRSIELLGAGAIPVMLVILGMQLARTRVQTFSAFIGLASLLRLVVSPVVAWSLATLLGIDGMARNVIVLQTSTPSAVLPLLYSVRFGTRPDLVANTIFVTTLLSTGTITFLLYILR